MTSAIDELHRMLDEQGVGSYTHEAPAAVCLAFFDGKRWHDCWESVGGEVNVTFSMTPEQAIAATLENDGVEWSNDGVVEHETCHNVHEPPKGTTFWPAPHFKCSECGEVHVSMQYVFYCPNCGRKVVDA